MKQIKKLASVLLALVMMLAMSVTAFAANDPVNGEAYNAYKIFDRTSSGGAYAYTIDANSSWYGVVNDYKSQTDYNGGLTLTKSADGTKYVVSGLQDGEVAAFAAYLKENMPTGVEADATTTAAEGSTTFTNLDEGYYLVTSSLGSTVATTDGSGNLTLKEKNTVPGITKTADKTSASIGEEVTYTLTFTDGDGTDKKATITDTLPDTLTYVENSLSYRNNTAVTNATVEGKKITVTIDTSKLEKAATVAITYKAVMNENAKANTAIKNNVQMTYSQQIDQAEATVYTYDFDLFKYYMNGETKTGLARAEFQLQKADGTTPIKLVKNENGSSYRVAKSGENDTTTTIVSTTEKVNIYGLAAGTYYLVETKAPAGYNLLTQKVEVTIEDKQAEASATTYEVENKAGSTLPTTGGMGTTVLYTVGGILVLGAGVLLVVRRRMSASK